MWYYLDQETSTALNFPSPHVAYFANVYFISQGHEPAEHHRSWRYQALRIGRNDPAGDYDTSCFLLFGVISGNRIVIIRASAQLMELVTASGSPTQGQLVTDIVWVGVMLMQGSPCSSHRFS